MSDDAAGRLDILKALGDPIRWGILTRIAACHGADQSELEELADVSRPTVSHHIKILRDAGIVTMQKDGRRHRYEVEPRTLAALLDDLEARLLRGEPAGPAGAIGEPSAAGGVVLNGGVGA